MAFSAPRTDMLNTYPSTAKRIQYIDLSGENLERTDGQVILAFPHATGTGAHVRYLTCVTCPPVHFIKNTNKIGK